MRVKSHRGSRSGPGRCPQLHAPRETDRAVARGLARGRCLQQKKKKKGRLRVLFIMNDFPSTANEGLLGRVTHLRAT